MYVVRAGTHKPICAPIVAGGGASIAEWRVDGGESNRIQTQTGARPNATEIPYDPRRQPAAFASVLDVFISIAIRLVKPDDCRIACGWARWRAQVAVAPDE